MIHFTNIPILGSIPKDAVWGHRVIANDNQPTHWKTIDQPSLLERIKEEMGCQD